MTSPLTIVVDVARLEEGVYDGGTESVVVPALLDVSVSDGRVG